MDLATIIGLISGAVLIVSAIVLGGSGGIFFNVPGILIVVGGTFATAFIKFTLTDVFNSIKVAMKAFLFKTEPPEEIIKTMIGYAKMAKKEGLISLDQENPKDPFMAKALRYLSDGYDEHLIEEMLNKDIRLTVARHVTGQGVFKGMGDSAPAFGMIGTLIGLVQMLQTMDDPSTIGPAMAVALLTTFYGALIANVVFLPISGKLRNRSSEEVMAKELMAEGIMSIAKGDNPRLLEQKLNAFLAPQLRESSFE